MGPTHGVGRQSALTLFFLSWLFGRRPLWPMSSGVMRMENENESRHKALVLMPLKIKAALLQELELKD